MLIMTQISNHDSSRALQFKKKMRFTPDTKQPNLSPQYLQQGTPRDRHESFVSRGQPNSLQQLIEQLQNTLNENSELQGGMVIMFNFNNDDGHLVMGVTHSGETQRYRPILPNMKTIRKAIQQYEKDQSSMLKTLREGLKQVKLGQQVYEQTMKSISSNSLPNKVIKVLQKSVERIEEEETLSKPRSFSVDTVQEHPEQAQMGSSVSEDHEVLQSSISKQGYEPLFDADDN